MRRYSVVTQKLNELPRTGLRLFDGARWRQLALNVAYVLMAAPLGLGYLVLLGIGLALDLVLLLIRVLVLVLGYTLARTALWLLQFGLRFLWVSAIAVLVWMARTLKWLIVSIVSALVHIVSIVLVDIIHPRTAWHRAVASMQGERERARQARASRKASALALPARIRKQVDIFFDAGAAGLERFMRQAIPHPLLFVPALWWRMARFERGHTMRWLHIDLPSLEPSPFMADSAAGQAAASPQLPMTSLAYLLAKLPLGILAIGVVLLAFGLWAALLHGTHLFYGGSAIAVALLAIYALHVLSRASARFAQRAFSPSATTRRLIEVEALAVQERAKADRAEQSRRDLIVNVGHELRTPTASIQGHVESLLLALDASDEHVDLATIRAYLGIVQREAERLGTLVGEMLSIARAETAALQLVIMPVDAAAVVEEVHQALAPLARRERQVALVYDIQPDLPPVLADRQRLAQVLLNLVRNAITYTPAGGIVSVTLRYADDEHLLLSVADTGTGIAPAELDRIFERFYRTDTSRARSSGGFGLGLAIVRDLVEAMHGEVTVESTPGEGSCFHVRLPIAARSSVPAL